MARAGCRTSSLARNAPALGLSRLIRHPHTWSVSRGREALDGFAELLVRRGLREAQKSKVAGRAARRRYRFAPRARRARTCVTTASTGAGASAGLRPRPIFLASVDRTAA